MTLATQVGPDTFVTLAYTLYDEEGEVIERTGADDPLTYVHGYGQIVPGLERALEGMARGATRSVVVPPEEAYGEYDDEGFFEVPRSEYPELGEVEVDDELVAEGPHGEEIVMRVVGVTDELLMVDANHPLAGTTLRFEIEILDVRPATEEEIADAEEELELLAEGCDDPTHDHGPAGGEELLWPGRKQDKNHGPS